MHQGSETEKDLNGASSPKEEVTVSEQAEHAAQEQTASSEVEDQITEEGSAASGEESAENDQIEELLPEQLQQRIAELEQQNQQLQEQSQANEQRAIRIQADLENFRRRARNEKEEILKFAAQSFIEELLPIVDNFDRALVSSQQTKDFDSLSKGISMINNQLFQLLEKEGVEKIEAVGQPFDPEYHQAVMQVESEEHDEGIVVEELQTGFIYKGKTIRPAMVKVSK